MHRHSKRGSRVLYGWSFIDVIFTNNVIQSTCREVYTNQNGLVGKYHIEICRRSNFQQTHRQKMLAAAVLRQGQKNKEREGGLCYIFLCRFHHLFLSSLKWNWRRSEARIMEESVASHCRFFDCNWKHRLQMLLLGGVLAKKPTELTIWEQGMLFGEAFL